MSYYQWKMACKWVCWHKDTLCVIRQRQMERLWPPCHLGTGWDVSLCFQGLFGEAESLLILTPIDIDTYPKELSWFVTATRTLSWLHIGHWPPHKWSAPPGPLILGSRVPRAAGKSCLMSPAAVAPALSVSWLAGTFHPGWIWEGWVSYPSPGSPLSKLNLDEELVLWCWEPAPGPVLCGPAPQTSSGEGGLPVLWVLVWLSHTTAPLAVISYPSSQGCSGRSEGPQWL